MIVEQFTRAQRADAATGSTPGPGPVETRARARLLQHPRAGLLLPDDVPDRSPADGVGEPRRDLLRTTAEHITVISLGALNETGAACGAAIPATRRRPAMK
jgi:hypothetical protein